MFRFPELNTDALANFGWLLLLLAATALATVIIHRMLERRHARRARRHALERLSTELQFPHHLQQLLALLVRISGHKEGSDLLRDAWTFEHAVQRLYDEDTYADQEAVQELRRHFHLNVSNPHLDTESTRQLLADQAIRLIASVEGETLDLYCTLVDVNESFLLIHLPEEPEIHALLEANPSVRLVVWREHEGETVFRTPLEFVPSEGMMLVHAKHAFRSKEQMKRSDFRLAVDFPVTYRYVERGQLNKLSAAERQELDMRHGEGRMVDMSYGGAAFAADQQLSPGGFAQLKFSLES